MRGREKYQKRGRWRDGETKERRDIEGREFSAVKRGSEV